MTLWTDTQRHQYLIVGIIGFVGVIFTLWPNAWEAHKQRQDERRHELETLYIA